MAAGGTIEGNRLPCRNWQCSELQRQLSFGVDSEIRGSGGQVRGEQRDGGEGICRVSWSRAWSRWTRRRRFMQGLGIHVEGMPLAYLPQERVLVEADL